MKWIAGAIVIAAIVIAATLIYLDRSRIECEMVTDPLGTERPLCRDGTGKMVPPPEG